MGLSCADQSGHIEPSSVKKQQAKAFQASGVTPFELYRLRHTCLTRWAPHMDPFLLGYLAGHTDMGITKRYVHPQTATVHEAMQRASGHRTRHTDSQTGETTVALPGKLKCKEAVIWCARHDSNMRPSGS